MTDLPFDYPSPATPTGAGPRRHRHEWGAALTDEVLPADDSGYVNLPDGRSFPAGRGHSVTIARPRPGVYVCLRCGAIRDETAARRGKSARRLGGDQERRIERRFGPTKIGERGDPVDHIGRLWKWQSKATRADPPRWLAAVIGPTWRATLPASVLRPLRAMDGLYGDRSPVVIRSYVHQGVATRDFLFVEANDWSWIVDFRVDGYVVVPGADWLDIVGRDEGGTG